MADRYWVGNSGTWDATTTTNWASTSGGASGASAPTTADNVFFDANSGTTPFTVTLGTNANCADMSVSVADITYANSVASTLTCRGNFDIHSQTVWNATSGISFSSQSGNKFVKANGVTISGVPVFNPGSGVTVSLASNFATVATNNVRIQANIGTFDGNGFTFTTANNITVDASTNSCTLNNVLFNGNLSITAPTPSGTFIVGGITSVGNLTFNTTGNFGIGANAAVTCNTNFSFGSLTTTRTFSMGANSRVYVGNGAANNSTLITANSGWSNLTVSQGTNAAFVIGYNGGASDVANVWGYTSTPTYANTFNLYVPQGSYRLSIQGTYRDLDFTGFSGNLDIITGGLSRIWVARDLTLSNTMTINAAGSITQGGNGGGIVANIQTNGLVIPVPYTIASTGSSNTTVVLQSNVELISNSSTAGNFNIGGGGFANFNGYSVTCSRLNWTAGSTSYMGMFTPVAGSTVNVRNNLGGTVVDLTGGNIPFTGTTIDPPITINVDLYTGNVATIQYGSNAEKFPLNIKSGSGALTFNSSTSQAFGDINFTGFTGSILQTGSNSVFYGNVILNPGMTVTSGSLNTWTFSGARNSVTYFNSAGVTINRTCNVGSSVANLVLLSNVTQGSNTVLNLDSASGGNPFLTMNGYNWSTFAYSSNNITVAFAGDSRIEITGQPGTSGTTQTFLNYTSNTKFTGNVRFSLTSNGNIGGTTVITTTATSANTGNRLLNVAVNDPTANISLPLATNTIRLDGNVRNLNLTGMTHTQAFSNNIYIWGNLTVPATGGTMAASANLVRVLANADLQGATNIVTVDTGNRLLDFPLNLQADTGSGLTANGSVRLLSNLQVSTTSNVRQFTVTANPLDLNNFVINCGNFNMNSPTTARSIAFGTSGQIILNGATTTEFNIANTSNFSLSGNAQVFINSPGAFTRTYTVGIQAGGANLPNLTVQGVAGSVANIPGGVRDLTINTSGSISNSTGPSIFGNYKYIAGTVTAGTQIWDLYGNTTWGNVFIDASGTAHNFNWRTRESGNYILSNNLIAGTNTVSSTRYFNHLAGNLQLNNFALFVGNFSASSATARTIDFGSSGNITLLLTGQTLWDTTDGRNFGWSGTFNVITAANGAGGTTRTYTFGNIPESGTFNVSAAGGANTLGIRSAYADNVSISGNILGLDLTGWTGNINWGNATVNVHGNLNIPATGGVLQGIGNTLNFTSTNATARTINTNGRATDFPYTFNGVGGTFTLVNNLIIGGSNTSGTRPLTLSGGNLNLNNFYITTNTFVGTGTSNRTLAFGSSGNLTLFGSNGTVINVATATDFNVSGTPVIRSAPSAPPAGTYRTFSLGSTAGFTTGGSANQFNTLNFQIGNSGSGIRFIEAADAGPSFTAGTQVRDLNLTGITDTFLFSNVTIYGNLSVPASGGSFSTGGNWTIAGYSGTYTVNTNARFMDTNFIFDGAGNFSVVANLHTGTSATVSARTITLNTGNLSIANNIITTSANFVTNSSNVRNIDFGGTGTRIRLLANNTTIWNSATGTNFSFSGTPYIESTPVAGATGTRTFNFGTIPEAFTFNIVVPVNTPGFSIGTGTDSVNISGNINGLNLTSFAGTLTNSTRNIHGNLLIPTSGGTLTNGTAVTSFTATSGTESINTNGRAWAVPFTFNGPGGTFVLDSNLVANTTTSLTLANGTVDFRQRGTLTFANILIAGGSGGNALITNLTTSLAMIHSSGNLTTLAGAVNSSTSNSYSLSGGNLIINAAFSTGAFTQTGGNIIL